MVEQVSTEQRRYAFGEKHAELGCMIVANRLWLNETRIPREQQQWESVLGALRDLAERASRMRLDLLWACAVRAQVMVLAEYCRDLTTAVANAEAALAKPLDDPRVQFLLRECVGRQYLYAHENGKALKLLRQALDLPTDAYPVTHMLAQFMPARPSVLMIPLRHLTTLSAQSTWATPLLRVTLEIPTW